MNPSTPSWNLFSTVQSKRVGKSSDGNKTIFKIETGDLKTYLLARRHLVYEKSREDSDEISGRRLTSIALDVAKALSYLAELKYVHR